MKKLIMTVAVLGCAAAVTAQTVTSANIVGYSKKALAASQFKIVSPQFLAGDAGGIALSDAFGNVNDMSVVFAWNGSSYTDYTYYDGYGWFDATFTPSDDVIVGQGDAVWLKDGGAGADVIMSGEVASSASLTNSLVVGFNLVANPYPVSLTLSEIPLASLSDLDVVFLWNGATYNDYTYYLGYGWFDATFTPSDSVAASVGQGFWLKSGAGGDLIFNKAF